MIDINCKGCNNHCCGENPTLTPVLLPEEAKRLKNYVKAINTHWGLIYVLEKKANGTCIFLDEDTRRCSRYEERPLECKLYPLLLDFSQKQPTARLNLPQCPNISTLIFDEKKIKKFISNFKFSKNWIKAYESLSNC